MSGGKISRFVQALRDGAPTQFKGEVLGREVQYTIFNGSSGFDDPESLPPARMWMSQPHLRTVVDFQARSISQLALQVFKRSGEEVARVRTGTIADILNKPNPEQTLTELLYDLVGDWSLYDDAYLAVLPNKQGSFDLRVIPSPWVSVVMKDSFNTDYYNVCNLEGGVTKIPAKMMLRFKGWTPADPTKGTSPVQTLRLILAEQHSARVFRNQVWKKSGRVGGIITRPKDAPEWDNTGRRRFLKMWEAFTGNNGDKAGEDVLLEDGMDYKRAGFGAREEQFVESSKLSLETVCQVYHINPTMVGMLDNANYSNVREFRRGLYGDTLGPVIKRLEDRLNTFLLPMLGVPAGTYVEFNVEQMLRGSFEEQAAVVSTATGAPWQTINESRKLFNLPPVEGGDVLVSPLNMAPVGDEEPADDEDTEKTEVPKFEDVFRKFNERQKKAVKAKLGAGVDDWWDEDRWQRELTQDLVKAGMPLPEAEFKAFHWNQGMRQAYANGGL